MRTPASDAGACNGPLAQLVEQKTFNLLVDGSNPSRPTIANKGFQSNLKPFLFFRNRGFFRRIT